jgi:hypothetical protein
VTIPNIDAGGHLVIVRGPQPVQAAFTAKDVAALGSLSAAFDKLVFWHPEVNRRRKLAKLAMAAAHQPFYDNAGYLSPVYGHDEKMLPLKVFARRDILMTRAELDNLTEMETESELGKLIRAQRSPKAYDDFCDEIEWRGCSLIGLLESGAVEAIGYAAQTSELTELLPTIWSREGYYVRVHTGDIYEYKAKRNKVVPKWTSVALRLAPSAVASQPIATSKVVKLPRPVKPSGLKRGPKDETRRRIAKQMLAELRAGIVTPDQLSKMAGPGLEHVYKVHRDTGKAARDIALAEFKYRQIAPINK